MFPRISLRALANPSPNDAPDAPLSPPLKAPLKVLGGFKTMLGEALRGHALVEPEAQALPVVKKLMSQILVDAVTVLRNFENATRKDSPGGTKITVAEMRPFILAVVRYTTAASLGLGKSLGEDGAREPNELHELADCRGPRDFAKLILKGAAAGHVELTPATQKLLNTIAHGGDHRLLARIKTDSHAVSAASVLGACLEYTLTAASELGASISRNEGLVFVELLNRLPNHVRASIQSALRNLEPDETRRFCGEGWAVIQRALAG